MFQHASILDIVGRYMAAPVTFCSRELKYVWASEAYASWIERPLNQIVGKDILDVLGPEAFDRLYPYFQRVLDGELVRYEEQVYFAGIGLRWIHATYTPVFDEQGLCIGWVALVLDIDARKRTEGELQESQTRSRGVADRVPVHIWIADENGRLVFANAQYVNYTGLTAEQLHPDGANVLHPDDVRDTVASFREANAKRVAYQHRARLRARDGSYRWFELFAQPYMEAGRLLGYVGVTLDIDERQRMESALRKRTEELERADAELQRINTELLNEHRRKDELLAVLAHELRQPLAPLRSASELVKRLGAEDRDTRLACDVIDRQVRQMARLLEDLWDVSRVARRGLTLNAERVTLHEIVGIAVELSASNIDSAGHELKVDLPSLPIHMNADRARLAQVFANLLSNAAKYTPRGGFIRIRVEIDGEFAVICVSDTGCGISAEMLPRVFDMFVRGEAASGRIEGLGIGLALAKGITELHGGTIEAESDGINKGSRFVVRLPIQRA